MLEEIGQGTSRIVEIVKALKSYTYLDQAPTQSVDVHEGLNDTLVILRSKLKTGIQVQREYAENLPRIEAYGSELNQVWTNIIDNAVSAMQGQGKIILKTYQEDSWVVVEIRDSGPGIPEEIQTKIFDPFFTTKAPGEGTGLGLNISHNIIVQKHKGKLNVTSKPGETCFKISLPIDSEHPQDEM
jgi:signal transduction histidine kinase